MYNCSSRPSFPVVLRKQPRPSVNPRIRGTSLNGYVLARRQAKRFLPARKIFVHHGVQLGPGGFRACFGPSNQEARPSADYSELIDVLARASGKLSIDWPDKPPNSSLNSTSGFWAAYFDVDTFHTACFCFFILQKKKHRRSVCQPCHCSRAQRSPAIASLSLFRPEK